MVKLGIQLDEESPFFYEGESPFFYEEDRSLDFGHGWRDVPHEIGPDSDKHQKVYLLDEDGNRDPYDTAFAKTSYAWIFPKEENDEWCIDNLRTDHVTEVHPEFRGVDNMESHFEFHNMTPEEMCNHLESLGIYPKDKK